MAFENSLEALITAGAEVSALHGIHKQQKFLFIAELSQAEQILDRGRCDAALALNSFDQNRDRRGRNRSARGFEIVVGNVAESLNERLETFLHLFLTGGGNSRECPAMEGIECGQNFKATFVVAEFARNFVKAFVRFGAAVREKDLPGSDTLHQFLRKLSTGLREVQIGNVHQLLRLLVEGLRDFSVCMPEATNCNSSREIEIAAAAH